MPFQRSLSQIERSGCGDAQLELLLMQFPSDIRNVRPRLHLMQIEIAHDHIQPVQDILYAFLQRILRLHPHGALRHAER